MELCVPTIIDFLIYECVHFPVKQQLHVFVPVLKKIIKSIYPLTLFVSLFHMTTSKALYVSQMDIERDMVTILIKFDFSVFYFIYNAFPIIK